MGRKLSPQDVLGQWIAQNNHYDTFNRQIADETDNYVRKVLVGLLEREK